MADDTQNSRNPANGETLAGALHEVLAKYMQGNVDSMLPAEVIAYDRETNRATVRPLIRILKTDNTLVTRAEIASVPVINIGGGNAVLTFPIAPGDLGWIQACDRDISLFLQAETDSPPNTTRMHSFSDAVFFPDQFRKWTLNAKDTANAVFQTLDGTQRISLYPNQIEITSDTKLIVDAPVTEFTGAIIIDQGILNFGTTILAGLCTGFAGFSSPGGSYTTTSGDLNVAGVKFAAHIHAQDDDSNGDTEEDTDGPKNP